jgi:hypothetical protein
MDVALLFPAPQDVQVNNPLLSHATLEETRQML